MAKEAAKGKTKVAVWIEDAHVKALEEVKKAHGTPVSESIRRALTEYFAKREPSLDGKGRNRCPLNRSRCTCA